MMEKRKCKICDAPIPKDRLDILPNVEECVQHSTAKPIHADEVIPEIFIDDYTPEDYLYEY